MRDDIEDLRAFGLSDADAALLRPYARRTAYGPGQRIQRAGEPIATCHFVTSGLASITCDRHGGVEVGTTRAPGFVGVSMLLGSNTTFFPVHAVTAVSCLSLASGDLSRCLDASDSLRRHMLDHVDRMLRQILARAVCHAMHATDARLAGWIIRHHDACGEPLRLTHDALARLLGVRRATITNAVHVLEGHRGIVATRTVIRVRDRDALSRCACGCDEPEDPPLAGARPRGRPSLRIDWPGAGPQATSAPYALPSAPMGGGRPAVRLTTPPEGR